MRRRFPIWQVTGAVALAAAALLAVRGLLEPPHPPDPATAPTHEQPTAPADAQAVVAKMLAALKRDTQAWRRGTQLSVEAAAALAEQNVLNTAETYYALGLRHVGERNYDDAEQAYRKAIAMKPEWSWPHNGLGILLYRSGQHDQAMEAFRTAMQLDPQWSRPHNDLAILLREAGRYEEAEVEALKALELGPDEAATHNNYANLLMAMERFEEAEREYCKAIEIEPDHPKPYYNMACLCSLRGLYGEVFPFLIRAIQIDDEFRERAKFDADFEPVREHPEFRRIVFGEQPRDWEEGLLEGQ